MSKSRCADCDRLALEYQSVLRRLEVFVFACARLTGPAFERQMARIESLKAECMSACETLDQHLREHHAEARWATAAES